MWRTVAAIIAGNLAWTVLWLALNVLLRSQRLLPADPSQRVVAVPGLITLLLASVLFSAAAGWITTAIARGGYAPALVLALIQLGLGIFFQAQAWQLMPLWYHVPFLLLIVPATLFGAWIRLR